MLTSIKFNWPCYASGNRDMATNAILQKVITLKGQGHLSK